MGQNDLDAEDIDMTISPMRGAMKRTWKAFCARTSIHGLKFTQDQDTNRTIRFIWLCITLIMFTCAVAMVTAFYLDYRKNPTRMNVDNDFAPTASLIYPCITICPEVSYDLKRARALLSTLRLPTNATIDSIVQNLYLVHGFENDKLLYKMENIETMEQVLQLNNLTMLEFLQELYWKESDIFFRCRLQQRIVNCSELFQTSRSSTGFCWSFNCNQMGLKFQPKYATHYGIFSGISTILHYPDNNFDLWPSYSIGFKILINQNNAFPNIETSLKFLPLNEQVFLSIKALETITSSGVRALPKYQRHCVYPEEVQLNYSLYYTLYNCELSCRISNMFKRCGCVTYFLINSLSRKHRVCTYADIPCLMKNYADIIGRKQEFQCNCPKLCESIDYHIQKSEADLQPDIPTVDDFYSGIKSNFSIAHIFFNSQTYRRVKQDLLSDTVTLVSNLGSAFSLFVGMSMVSVVEIIYFFTIILRRHYLQEVQARQKILFRKLKRISFSDSEENRLKFVKVN